MCRYASNTQVSLCFDNNRIHWGAPEAFLLGRMRRCNRHHVPPGPHGPNQHSHKSCLRYMMGFSHTVIIIYISHTACDRTTALRILTIDCFRHIYIAPSGVAGLFPEKFPKRIFGDPGYDCCPNPCGSNHWIGNGRYSHIRQSTFVCCSQILMLPQKRKQNQPSPPFSVILMRASDDSVLPCIMPSSRPTRILRKQLSVATGLGLFFAGKADTKHQQDKQVSSSQNTTA